MFTADTLLEGLNAYRIEISVSMLLSIVGYKLCVRYIPMAQEVLFDRGIYGIDINKNSLETRKKFGEWRRAGDIEKVKKFAIPESLGIVVGGIYLCIIAVTFLCQSIYNTYYADATTPSFPLLKANAAVNSIAVMLLLGFVDDVLDVRWRYKIVLSVIGVLPLLLAYDGSVSILVPDMAIKMLPAGFIEAAVEALPSALSSTVRVVPSDFAAPIAAGGTTDLLIFFGPLYLVYMGAFCVFCTNSINILAGVNGVEVGQSIIIGIASIVHNLLQLRHVRDDPAMTTQHVLTLMLLIPFVGVSLALWKFNKYPSRVFVGDSYTYFAGMTLAVAGITGSYTKTLVLFFLPQLINFVLSIPQLFHIVECPRHRVPTWDAKRNVLTNSRNYTILNAFLAVFGDMKESTLTTVTLVFQVACCGLALFVRYFVAGMIYKQVV